MSLVSQLLLAMTRSANEIKNRVADVHATFSSTGALSVKVGTGRFPISGGTYTIAGVVATVGTAPTGSAIIVDVDKNGTTIYGTQANRPTIAAGSNSASGGNPSVTTVTTGDYLTVDIDQIGSTVSGSDLVVVIRLRRTS